MILADSNVWFAYFDRSDDFHEQAVDVIEGAKALGLVLPYSVLTEVATLLAYKRGKNIADEFLMTILNTQEISVIDNEPDVEVFYFLNFETKMSLVDYSCAYLSNQYSHKLVTFDRQLKQFAKRNKDVVIRLRA